MAYCQLRCFLCKYALFVKLRSYFWAKWLTWGDGGGGGGVVTDCVHALVLLILSSFGHIVHVHALWKRSRYFSTCTEKDNGEWWTVNSETHSTGRYFFWYCVANAWCFLLPERHRWSSLLQICHCSMFAPYCCLLKEHEETDIISVQSKTQSYTRKPLNPLSKALSAWWTNPMMWKHSTPCCLYAEHIDLYHAAWKDRLCLSGEVILGEFKCVYGQSSTISTLELFSDLLKVAKQLDNLVFSLWMNRSVMIALSLLRKLKALRMWW